MNLKLLVLLPFCGLILTACYTDSQDTNSIAPLLPDLEARTQAGFTPDKAKTGLDETLATVEDLISSGIDISDINFDVVSASTPSVAGVPPGNLVISYGDRAPVVAVETIDDTFNSSSYAGDGICFFLNITKDSQDTTVRKGVDFSVTCNPLDYTENAVWATADTLPESVSLEWPATSAVIMPVSPNPIEQGELPQP